MRRQRECEFEPCAGPIAVEAPENQRYCSSRCRTAHWRARKATGEGNGPGRRGDAQNGRKRSGRQVSYRKAVRVLGEWLAGEGEGWTVDEAQGVAAGVLARALPDRQAVR